MIRGLYTSAWSMLANNKKMDVISNNIANVNTTAYKKDTVVFESFPNLLTKRINDTKSALNPTAEVGDMQLSSDVGEVFTYYRQGQLIKTDNRMDLAIQDGADKESYNKDNRSEGFFTIGIPDEQGNYKEYYTRDGSFKIDINKNLVTKDGYAVMGQKGPITLENENFTIMDDGTIQQDGKAVDKLLMKEFVDTSTLRKFGSNLVTTTDQSEGKEFTGTIHQGFSEQSNVNIVKEMVDMINVMRQYETNQKMIQFHDGTLEKVVNEVGAVR